MPGRQLRSEFLQIRLTPDEKRRIEEASREDHLDASTWVRRVVLQKLDETGGASQ